MTTISEGDVDEESFRRTQRWRSWRLVDYSLPRLGLYAKHREQDFNSYI